MLPHHHFLIAGAVIAPAAVIVSPERSAGEIAGWVLVGGLLSAVIDLDVIMMVLLRSRKEPRLVQFRNPLRIFMQFGRFMDAITATGVLRTAMMTHVGMSALVLLFSSLLTPAFFVPAVLAVLSHIASDIPNIWRAVK